MNQDKIRELTGYATESMDSLEIRDSSSLLPIKVYRQQKQQSWTSYSENSLMENALSLIWYMKL